MYCLKYELIVNTPAAKKKLKLGETALHTLGSALTATKRSGTAPKALNRVYKSLNSIPAKEARAAKSMSTYVLRKRKKVMVNGENQNLGGEKKDAITEA